MEVSDNIRRIRYKIAQLRKKLGYLKKASAFLAGIERTNVSKKENGRYNISIDLSIKGCYALILISIL